jgi:ribosomal protein L6P/L9E
MVKGVTEGFTKQLELVGVGYKATNAGNTLDLSLGYSHNIIFDVPKEVKVATETEKGQNPKITLEGNDNQLLGAVAAKIAAYVSLNHTKEKVFVILMNLSVEKLVKLLVSNLKFD